MAKKTRTQVSDLKVGSIVNAESVKFKPRAARGTEYQPILDKMKELKKGQALMVPVPEGIAPDVFHNRLNAALRRFPVEAPKGTAFEKRTTEDGRVAICLVETK